jgi:hypothetical protein
MAEEISQILLTPRKHVSVIIKAEVEVWNPLTDLTPIHTWLHPWLPPLGNRLEIVYPPIRNKLAAALASWHPGTNRPSYCNLYFNFLRISVILLLSCISEMPVSKYHIFCFF